MDIVWINAVLLPLAALVVVPLLVHLFARSRPPQLAFSSVRFVRRVVRDTQRVRKPREWLLLLLRTAVVLLLVGLFLRPMPFGRKGAGEHGAPRTVIMVVDRTASMGCSEGAHTRFAAACAEAADVLTGLDARDRANVVWLDAMPDAVFPEPGPNADALVHALRSTGVSFEQGAIVRTIDLAVSMFGPDEGRHQIVIVSDFQATEWRERALEIPVTIDLVCVPVGHAAAGNTAITDVSVSPSAPLVDETVTVTCDVWNYGNQPVQSTLFAALGETRTSRDLRLLPRTRTPVSFPCGFRAPGQLGLRLALSSDAFPADDARHVVVHVRPHLNAVLAGTPMATMAVWERALRSLNCFHIVRVPTVADALGETSDVVLASVAPGGLSGVAEVAAAGERPLLLSPEAGVSMTRLAECWGGEWEGEPVTLPRQRNPALWPLEVAEPGHPALAVFADGQYADPAGGAFASRLYVPAERLAGARVLLAYRDGVPAVAQPDPDVPLYLWLADLDPRAGNWAGTAGFLPFFAELLFSERDTPRDGIDRLPGDRVAYETDLAAAAVGLVHAATGERLNCERSETDRRALLSARIDRPGLYHWVRNGEVAERLAVVFPPIESDLACADAEAVVARQGVVATSGERLREWNRGRRLWPLLLALGVAMAILESGVLVLMEGRA